MNEKLQQLTERLEKTAAGYGMEISSHKIKILVNSIKPTLSTNIFMNGRTMAEVEQCLMIHTNQRRIISKGSKD